MNKKIIMIMISLIIILTGCNLSNNPTSKTEELLGNYQKIKKIDNKDILLITNNNISEKEKEEYQKIIKKQYHNMQYEIKEEEIDGKKATVKVEIEVQDFIKAKETASSEELIKKLKQQKHKVTYTIDFTLTKDKEGIWHIDNLTEEQKEKLLGIY